MTAVPPLRAVGDEMPRTDFPASAGGLQRQLDAPSQAQMRILVVDDEPDVARALADVLRLELGCSVDVACDGQSAWARVVERAPDVLILDVRMPGVGGLDVARRVLLHGASGVSALPLLIAITGHDASDVVTDLTDSFRYAFSKPVDIPDLLHVLRAHWRGEDHRAVRSRFELSSLVSRTVAEATTMCRTAGLDLAFDYDGPFVVLDEDDPALHAALFRLLCAIHDLVGAGSALCHASVRVMPGDGCRFVLQIPATGQPGPRTLDQVLMRLRLAEAVVPGAAAAPAGLRQASGRCPTTGGRVTLVSVPDEGVLIRYERQWRATEVVELPAGGAAGRRAAIVGAGAVEGLVFARRLARLGWRVARFDSAAAMADAQRALPPASAPDLVFSFDTAGSPTPPGPPAPGAATPTWIPVVAAGSTLLSLPPELAQGEPRVSPVSTAELVALTRRFVAPDTEDGRRLDEACTRSMELPDPPRVLVVDDIELNRIVASGLLALLGCRIDEAADGLDAVDHCRRWPPDAVLMDVNMPVLGGLETTRHLRELQRLGRLPPFAIVAATADSEADTARRCREAGMDAVLTKPLFADELKRTLDRVILRPRR